MTTKPLSLAELQALSDDALRIMVAKACGWKMLPVAEWKHKRTPKEPHPSGKHPSVGSGVIGTEIPDYLHDLNAIARAEETLTDEQQPVYVHILKSKVLMTQAGVSDFDLMRATARQRCLAFLATMQNQ